MAEKEGRVREVNERLWRQMKDGGGERAVEAADEATTIPVPGTNGLVPRPIDATRIAPLPKRRRGNKEKAENPAVEALNTGARREYTAYAELKHNWCH